MAERAGRRGAGGEPRTAGSLGPGEGGLAGPRGAGQGGVGGSGSAAGEVPADGRPSGPSGEGRDGGEIAAEPGSAAQKAVLARIMRGSTRFKGRRAEAAQWSNSRDPKTAGELVDELIAVEGWQTDASAGLLLADWPRIVGPQVAAHCQVVGLEEGKLTVKADSSPWATEIRLLIPQLRAAIDKHVGPGLVTQVEVLGPEARRAGRRRT
ncbi:MAG: DUF721 domain-containing protein [Bifidobacteriaceae bacterium]|nr:DUF721 domain-containing protein [Bifidobacteriaceae bacterium]